MFWPDDCVKQIKCEGIAVVHFKYCIEHDLEVIMAS